VRCALCVVLRRERRLFHRGCWLALILVCCGLFVWGWFFGGGIEAFGLQQEPSVVGYT